MESISDGQRVKIGDDDTDLTPGTHTYAITYVADREIGFFDKYDELYWNVTGNGWKFPIEHAEATIHLPPGRHIVQSAFYTGDEGSNDQNATSNIVSDDTIHFVTTTQLTEMQGLTVAVGFSKGAVIAADRPASCATSSSATMRALSPRVVGFLFLLIYFGVTWLEFGRDPKRGTIMPLFAPPDGLSPAAVRYIHRMAYDRKSYRRLAHQHGGEGLSDDQRGQRHLHADAHRQERKRMRAGARRSRHRQQAVRRDERFHRD